MTLPLVYRCSHSELARVCTEVDVVITDPPYDARTHAGQTTSRADMPTDAPGLHRDGLSYTAWGEPEIATFVDTWHRRTRRWIAVLCAHGQIPVYEHYFRAAGRYVFAPVPCIIRGMTVRLAGDGPSSWAVYLLAARPKGMRPLSGTLPGAYFGKRESMHMPGAKPEWLMRTIVRDYSRASDLVCDPCSGSGTTLVAAAIEGRRAVGCDVSPQACALARERLSHIIAA